MAAQEGVDRRWRGGKELVNTAVDPRSPNVKEVAIAGEPSYFVSDRVIRVLAPNPSMMTLNGTNTYIVRGRTGNRALIVDPGPAIPSHLARLEQIITDLDLEVTGVLLTHGHLDHSESARDVANEHGVPIFAHPDALISDDAVGLDSVGESEIAGVPIEIVPTPGHCRDHLAYLIDRRVLLSGDHILGAGTTVVLHPDGRLEEYLASIAAVERLQCELVLPGHGPEIAGAMVAQVLSYYRLHRLERLTQIRRAVADAPGIGVGDLVDLLYGRAIDERVVPAATATTLAALVYLTEHGDLIREHDTYSPNGGSDSK
jgi:glyoxylase-like metal-dependent hydrolase (beta-lactamase superfamily II)